LHIGCANDQAGHSLARARPPRLRRRLPWPVTDPLALGQARGSEPPPRPPSMLAPRASSFDERADQGAGAQAALSLLCAARPPPCGFTLVTCHDHRRGFISNRSCQSSQRDADPGPLLASTPSGSNSPERVPASATIHHHLYARGECGIFVANGWG
jgi:hypothetical protein